MTSPGLKVEKVYYYLNSYDGRYAEHQGSGFKNKMEKDQKDNI